MKKILKGILVLISIICIAFTAFFVYSYASGNTMLINKLEAGIVKTLGKPATDASNAIGSKVAVSMLTSEYGLSKKQAEQVVSLAEDLGINTGNAAEMNALISNNAGHADELRELAAAVQAGQISEAQARSQLAKILDY